MPTGLWKTTRAGSSSVVLAAIVAASLAVKLLLAWLVAGMDCSHDQCDYRSLALAMHAGEGLQPHDGYLWPPGFIAILAGCLTVFGDTLSAPRILQALISTATVPAVYLIGRRFADERAGLVAAALFAFYPNLIGFTHLLWPETLYLLPFLWGFWFLTRAGGESWRDILLGGALLGLAALIKGVALFFVPVAALWTVWRGSAPDLRSRLVPGLLLVGAALMPILPWATHNWVRHDRFFLIDTTLGHNLYIGTNEAPPSNWDLGLNERRRIAGGRPRCTDENPVDSDRCEIRNALVFAVSHPGTMLRQVPVKLADLLNPSSFVLRHVRVGHYPYAFSIGQLRALTLLLSGSYLALAALGICGLTLSGGAPGRRLMLMLIAYHLAVHAVTFGMSRFRLPLIPFLIVAAAPLLTRSWRPPLAATPPLRLALGIGALLLVAALWAWRLPTVLDVFGPAGPLGVAAFNPLG